MPNTEKLYRNLVEIKYQTDALLAYANAQTGKDDPGLGEAIRSLVEGMGNGGVTTSIVSGTVTVEEPIRDLELPSDVKDAYEKSGNNYLFIISKRDPVFGVQTQIGQIELYWDKFPAFNSAYQKAFIKKHISTTTTNTDRATSNDSGYGLGVRYNILSVRTSSGSYLFQTGTYDYIFVAL